MVCWYWVYLAIFSGHHWDWSTPVTLTRHAPVTQTEVNGFLTFAFCFQFGSNRIKGSLEIQTIKFARSEKNTFFSVSRFRHIQLAAIGRLNHRDDV
ncbi:Uncharacterised protein [Vibrio cholerae]|uniref:Uncharacterized protein n=1 Tax=Vibrio cholerae TaxID=666 RepID=A0A655YYJ4_VIBCL|nr:Uncharacterised protein [Vibrio cholerae]CSD41891.1 Uncharacterised protein [Vibrio cholerae]